MEVLWLLTSRDSGREDRYTNIAIRDQKKKIKHTNIEMRVMHKHKVKKK